MFKALHELARSSPITLLIATEATTSLRVTVAQKSTSKGVPLSISVVGTPEELDAELPGAIAAAAEDLKRPAPVAEQVRSQVDAAKAAAPKPKPAKKAAPAKPARKTKPAAKKKPTAKPKPAARPKPKPKALAPAKLRASRPGAEACIADYVALYSQLGANMNRETFMEKATTGRRFERVFGNWTKFVEAASQQLPAGGDDQTIQLQLEPPAAAPRPAEWPFPRSDRSVESAAPAAEPPPAPAPAPSPAGNPAPEAADPVETPPRRGRTIVDANTKAVLAEGVELQAETGLEIDVPPHGRFTIFDFDEALIIVIRASVGASTHAEGVTA